MNFGEALNEAKKGEAVQRLGWNGQGIYVRAQLPGDKSKMTHSYLYVVIPECVEGTRMLPWQPAQVDLFGEDWSVVVPVK